MKQSLYILTTALLLASCIDYDAATTEIAVRVQLTMPSEFTGNAGMAGHEIVLQQGTTRLQATTDAEGVATFTNLIPDIYDISCSWEITSDQYRQLTQQELNGGTSCTIAGSLNSHLISKEQTIELATNLSINRDILIGKIYYAGSKDNNNRTYMPGKYLELYNNGNSAVDVAGYYIGLIEAESKQAYTLDNLHEAFADSVVLAKQIFRIPANKPFPVQPGGTVLIVNSATDHTYEKDMESDLSDADFEAKDMSGRTQNNPATPALELIYTMYPSISNMNLIQSGPCAVVIFHTDEQIADWQLTYPYGKTSGSQWKLVPKRLIIDGVEALANKVTGIDVSTKRLYADIDAGYTYIEARSGWTGEVVYRRTADKRGADGHKMLVDTNNSSNDFHVSTTIKPRQYDE